MSIHSIDALPFATTGAADEFAQRYPEEYAALVSISAQAARRARETAACPICKRTYVTIGRSIHYCQDRRDARGGGEYVAHFDNQQVGHSYDTYLQAEEALDDYSYWLHETSLVGALGVAPDDLPVPPSLDPDDVMDPRD